MTEADKQASRLYLEDELSENMEVVVPSYDVAHMMCAGIDALRAKPSRR